MYQVKFLELFFVYRPLSNHCSAHHTYTHNGKLWNSLMMLSFFITEVESLGRRQYLVSVCTHQMPDLVYSHNIFNYFHLESQKSQGTCLRLSSL